MKRKLVIATRGSMLALWQANHIKALLEAEHDGLSVELLTIKTQGDKILDVPLAKIGGKGLFVKEIEEALLDGRADLAVHSMKDVPVELPDQLEIGVTPTRELPTDTLCSVNFASLAELPQGARVGTASLRRQAQLLMLRPDLTIETLRGNLDTRLKKLLDGQYDAIVLASAGLKRLGLSAPRMEVLAPPAFLPAVAQGALGIEYRRDDDETAELLDFLNDDASAVCVTAERGFLTGLQGGCQVPIAGHATMPDEETVRLEGLVASVDGKRSVRRSAQGDAEDAWDLGQELAQEILDAGGREILDEIYSQAE
ncbi:Porphobilinogen deaminase [Desulfovibrio sp. X2]|uniref:hydroxymethylbilane synthase n=1 Tax=Desulfovibrio sp. X2 TaxID=941449 RepID=UPI00035896E3|nr:hydroxymethylbilane synthase [Desulfovibrio sp. X2]EPR40851.1 Porphobilinogen deaminase [Desulfovibrio sp. X2]